MPDRFGAHGDYALRPPEPTDVDALMIFKNDPDLSELLVGSGRRYTRTDLEAWVEAHRTAPDEAFFVIADGADRAVGHVALYQIDRTANTAEFGILIGDRRLWGHGLGTFYTGYLIEHGFDTLGLRRIFLEVLETNPRARAVYERLGFVVEGRLREHRLKGGRLVDVFVMGLLRDEYQRGADEPAAAPAT